MWIEGDPQPDTYAAFRGTFQLDREAEVKFSVWGASWFLVSVVDYTVSRRLNLGL